MSGSATERRIADGVYWRAVLCIGSFAVLLRLCTGTHSYSGMQLNSVIYAILLTI
jgi:hypothetical protein